MVPLRKPLVRECLDHRPRVGGGNKRRIGLPIVIFERPGVDLELYVEPETLRDARRMPPALKLAEQNDRNRGCGNGHVPFWLTPGEPFKGEGERCL